MISEVKWEYAYTMDPVPQQRAEHNKLFHFFDELRAGRLVTTKCPACGKVAWPPRTVCPACFEDELEWIILPSSGTVQGFSIQTSGAPPGFSLPMVFARVELTEQIHFVGRVVEVDPAALKVGAKMELVVVPAPGNRVLWAFRPKREGHS